MGNSSVQSPASSATSLFEAALMLPSEIGATPREKAALSNLPSQLLVLEGEVELLDRLLCNRIHELLSGDEKR